MRIEAARTIVARTPLPFAAAEELRQRARLRSVHYSTRIEGNRLTLEEAGRVVSGQRIESAGRERDVREVEYYWYQFVTIHPYYDGNGRTARLLATYALHRGGYELNGIFSLEEYHARDLNGYYAALAVHAHHN